MIGSGTNYKKKTVIKSITNNSVYQPDSRLRLNVEKALNKWSLSDLYALQTLLGIKLSDERNKE